MDGDVEGVQQLAKRDPSRRALLGEWRFHLRQPNLDETIVIEHDTVFRDPREFLKVWTARRLAMYEYLRQHPDVPSLNDLAKRLRRNYRNVYEDAHRLARAGVLALDRESNSLVPRVLAHEVTVTV